MAAEGVAPFVYGLGFAVAAVAGVLDALQTGQHATLGAVGGQGFAACISFATALVCGFAFLAFDVRVRKTPLPTRQQLKAAPLWSWVGGVCGAIYVAFVIVFAPKIGAGNCMAVVLSCQLAAAVALDLLGAVGYARRAVSWPRLVGVVVMVAGVALVTAFPGELAAQGAAAG